MQRNLRELERKAYDVLVVGGGIFGAAAAWEAVNRGLSVALIERDDFIHATSASCFKIIHGGVRYMQHADIARVRSSVAERSAFLRIAPHLAAPLPIVVPTYGHGKQSRALLRAGLLAYETLTLDCNRGISDPERRIRRHQSIDAAEVVDDFSWLARSDLSGAIRFSDAQMYSPERLGLAFIQSAAETGACVANYVGASALLRSGQRVTGVRATDAINGDSFEIRARCVINAAGPWAEGLLDEAGDVALKQHSRFSRDAWFLLRRRWVSESALAVQARTRDPDAILARSARHLFAAPWRDHTIVGVWHRPNKREPDAVEVSDEDLGLFLDELNWACPGLNARLDEVGAWSAGLVLFGENAPGQRHLRYGKRSRLVDHAAEDGVAGLITLIGVRYTTARAEAERALDMLQRQLGQSPVRSVTANRTLAGGDIDSIDALRTQVKHATTSSSGALNAAVQRSLAHNYGSRFTQVLDCGVAAAQHLIPDTHVLEAEVRHACRSEMALRLADVVLRRTEMADGRHPGSVALDRAAGIMAEELGWSSQRKLAEIEGADRALVRQRYRRVDTA